MTLVIAPTTKAIFHDVEQNSEAWENLRIGKATCSNFSCFMANYGKAFGDPAKAYALQIALEILTGKKDDVGFSNEHTERGHAQEPIARMLYQDETFTDVMNGGFFDLGRYGDSPDGLVNNDGVIEIKSVIAKTHYATLRRGSFDPAYRWQLIGHLDCTDRVWVDFISYCSAFPVDRQLYVKRLYREECLTEISQLKERREEFLKLVSETIYDVQSAF